MPKKESEIQKYTVQIHSTEAGSPPHLTPRLFNFTRHLCQIGQMDRLGNCCSRVEGKAGRETSKWKGVGDALVSPLVVFRVVHW